MGLSDTYFQTEEQIEARATGHAFALIAVAADAAGTKKRLTEIAAATKEHAATRDAAAANVADAEAKLSALADASRAHSDAEELFNARVDVNEKRHRQREESVRKAEAAVAER